MRPLIIASCLIVACSQEILIGGDLQPDGESPTDMRAVTDASGRVFFIDIYEASVVPGVGVWGSSDQDADNDGRVADPLVASTHEATHGLRLDDDGGEEGVVVTTKIAQSVAGEVPAEASYYQAAAACARADKRLCTAAEWTSACKNGTAFTSYPYGDAFDGGTEPGVDCWSENLATAAQVTGSAGACRTNDGVFDMSGNVAEWVDYVDATAANQRGGNVATDANRVTCDAVLPGPPGSAFLNLGFRCCKAL